MLARLSCRCKMDTCEKVAPAVGLHNDAFDFANNSNSNPPRIPLRYIAIKRKVDESSPRAPPAKKARFLGSYPTVCDVDRIKEALDIKEDNFQLEIIGSFVDKNASLNDETSMTDAKPELSSLGSKSGNITLNGVSPANKTEAGDDSEADSSKYIYDVYVYEDELVVEEALDGGDVAIEDDVDSNDENHPANEYPDSVDETDEDDFEDDDSYGGFDPDDYLIDAQDRLAFVDALEGGSDVDYDDVDEDDHDDDDDEADVNFAHHG